MVYVINKNGLALMPCTEVIARLLIKKGGAKCISRFPFVIKLTYDVTNYVQSLTHGIDTGSSKFGSSVLNSKNEVLYLSEIEIRNDISDKMRQRSKYRRNRRNRKTRYREPRWLNRKNSIREDRFSPTMISKINSHIKEINFVKSILPISKWIIETGTFDPHALKNPEVLNNKDFYQKGINYGFANTKAFILDRDSYICQNCKGKSKDSKLEVHHIIFRRDNGSDEHENLTTLCNTCHGKVHNNELKLKINGKIKGNLKHATQMNSIRQQLIKLLPYAEETFGFITKQHRQLLGLHKEHYMDAVAIACNINLNFKFKSNNILLKRCVSDGDYQQTKGIRSEQKIPTNKINGFRKFDRVIYLGSEYFIKGRMSIGYAILSDIDGNKINLKPIPKFSKMQRFGARKSWIIQQKIIANFC
jgi:hypothetical protein